MIFYWISYTKPKRRLASSDGVSWFVVMNTSRVGLNTLTTLSRSIESKLYMGVSPSSRNVDRLSRYDRSQLAVERGSTSVFESNGVLRVVKG